MRAGDTQELVACLRRRHGRRKPRPRGVLATQGKLQDIVLDDQRPAEVEPRLIAGHYDGDLIMGMGNCSAVGVLVEPTTRYTFLCHFPQRDAPAVRADITRKLQPIPSVLRKTLTYD